MAARRSLAGLLAFACLLLIGGYVVLLAMAAGRGAWLVRLDGTPAPADFNCFWAAGKLAVEGRSHDVYAWPALRAVLEGAGSRAVNGSAEAVFPFFYPPVFLLWLTPLGLLPYAGAAWAWIGGSLAAYVAALRAISRKPLPLLAGLASPAAFACLYIGQNGLLSAALAGGGLALLKSRPVIAGVLLGLLAFKPQLGVALPLLLVAGGRWRVIAAAVATVAVSYGLAGLALGWELYARFWAALLPRDGGVAAVGLLQGGDKLQSMVGLLQMLGASRGLAWAGYGLLGLASAGVALRIWRSGVPQTLQSAAAAATMLIASPYAGLYDYPLLAVGIAFLLADLERAPLSRVQAAGLVAAFAAPFAAAAFALPLCPIGAVVLLAVALSRGAGGITKVSSTAKHPNDAALAS